MQIPDELRATLDDLATQLSGSLTEAHASLTTALQVAAKIEGIREAVEAMTAVNPVPIALPGYQPDADHPYTPTGDNPPAPAAQRQPVQKIVLDVLRNTFATTGMSLEHIVNAARSAQKVELAPKSVSAVLKRGVETGTIVEIAAGLYKLKPLAESPAPPADALPGDADGERGPALA